MNLQVKELTVAEKVAHDTLVSNEDLLRLVLDVENNPHLVPVADYLTMDMSLHHLVRMTVAELELAGVPRDKAITLRAMMTLTHRSLVSENYAERVLGSQSIAKSLMLKYGSKKQEHFVAIFLDSSLRIIKEEVIHIGSVNRSIASTKDVLAKAIHCSATAMLICHNHPSGRVTPSKDDDEVTKKIAMACELLEVELLDHLIVSNFSYYSYREEDEL